MWFYRWVSQDMVSYLLSSNLSLAYPFLYMYMCIRTCYTLYMYVRSESVIHKLLLNIIAPMHAQGVKWSRCLSYSFCPAKNIQIPRSSPSQSEPSPVLLTYTCNWTNSLWLPDFSAFFLLSGPLWQPLYLQPWVTPTNYMPCANWIGAKPQFTPTPII